MIAGGAEAAVTPLGVGGFAVMRALSTRNDEPQRASRPFDRERDGFVIGEGAGVLVLEALEHGARARRDASTPRSIGYGANCRRLPHHHAGAGRARCRARCMRLALERRGHRAARRRTTSTRTAPRRRTTTRTRRRRSSSVFGAHARAAGGELDEVDDRTPARRRRGRRGRVHRARAARPRCLPPTINYENPDPACDLDYVPNIARHVPRARRALELVRLRRRQRLPGVLRRAPRDDAACEVTGRERSLRRADRRDRVSLDLPRRLSSSSARAASAGPPSPALSRSRRRGAASACCVVEVDGARARAAACSAPRPRSRRHPPARPGPLGHDRSRAGRRSPSTCGLIIPVKRLLKTVF